jgi:hypothetical protein
LNFCIKSQETNTTSPKKKKASLKNSRNQSLRKKRTSIEQKSLVKHRNKKEISQCSSKITKSEQGKETIDQNLS